MRSSVDSRLIQAHLDKYLPQVPSAYFKSERLGVGIAQFDGVPDPGLISYLTVGVSGQVLAQPSSGVPICQELLMCCDRSFASLDWSSVLWKATALMLDRKIAFARGEIIRTGEAFLGSGFPEYTSLVPVYPLYFPESFAEVSGGHLATVVVELLPLTDRLVRYVEQRGIDSFMDLLYGGVVRPYALGAKYADL